MGREAIMVLLGSVIGVLVIVSVIYGMMLAVDMTVEQNYNCVYGECE